MFIPLAPSFQSTGTYGTLPARWAGEAAVDADAGYWRRAPVGSIYYRKVEAGHYQECTKVKNDGTVSDWSVVGVIRESVTLADFTDGGATAGTYVLPQDIPDKSWLERCVLYNLVVAGAGITTLVVTVGDGTDVDKMMTGTPSIAASADVVDLGVPSAPAVVTAITTPTITVTEATDFGDVTALTFDIEIRYRSQGT